MNKFLLFLFSASLGLAQTIPAGVGVFNLAGNSGGGGGGSGTVTNVSWTGGIVTVTNPTTTPAFTIAGTSGGIPYFSSTSTWASSGLLAANSLMIGGGAGVAPSTTTTGTGILTFLGTPSSANLAAAVTDETGSGVLVFGTSPAFTTSITTASTTFTALAGATTLINWGGTGAAASNFFVSTLDATSSTTGAIRTSGGISAAKALNIGTTATIGTTLTVTGISGLGIATSSSTDLNLPASTTSVSSLRIAHGAAPTAPVNGDVWTTTSGMFARINGATVGPFGAGGGTGTVTVVGAGSLTPTALVTGGGTTTLQTAATTATMDSSGNISTPGTLTTGSGASTAGAISIKQGTTQSAGTTNITIQAPTAVTSYVRTLPGSAATGLYLGTNSAGVVTDTQVAAPTGTIVGTSDTQTLTNKRVTARLTPLTSSATPTVNTDNTDCVNITALAAAITSMTTNLTGTPSDFDQLEYRIKDNGTARAITWGASFASGTGTLPTTTTLSKVLHVYFEWDSVQTKWICASAGSEP